MIKSKEIPQDRIKEHLLKSKGKINRRELLKLVLPGFETRKVPSGKLRLDSYQCTGCGLCIQECSAKALVASLFNESDNYQLLFRQDLCMACNRCVEVCPEECLHLERIPGPDKINSPPALLFKSKIARCRACGNVIGSKAMINGLQVKLQAVGSSLALQLELCPACKIKHSILGRATFESSTRGD
jgi:ferredoxin